MLNGREKIRTISLIYHDVVDPGSHELSGFPSADAAAYKLAPQQFESHIEMISGAVSGHPLLVHELPRLEQSQAGAMPWMISFDDGGESSHSRIAGLLEQAGWRGHFFIATDYIGSRGFMSRDQIRDLHRRGHLIGSHSCSHPLRFASQPARVIEEEWRKSIDILSDLLGDRVNCASIPGGQYSKQVAEMADSAGVDALFTSEPKSSISVIGSCRVIGRYSIQRRTPPAVAAAIASGRVLPRYRQWFWWEFKKMIKQLGGNHYLKLRQRLMREMDHGY